MTNRNARRVAENIRKANSSDSAYQHMLDTIAEDIDAEFCGEKVCAFRVSEFVRKWSPSNGEGHAQGKPDPQKEI